MGVLWLRAEERIAAAVKGQMGKDGHSQGQPESLMKGLLIYLFEKGCLIAWAVLEPARQGTLALNSHLPASPSQVQEHRQVLPHPGERSADKVSSRLEGPTEEGRWWHGKG